MSILSHSKLAAFTLVEVAVVLVIIGLLVGGVLAGQDLIKNSEMRATITELEQYNAGSATFISRYGGIPGDLLSRKAQQLNFASAGTDGTVGRGNNNGILENGAVAAHQIGAGGENTLFWVHLAEAQFIPGQFVTADGSLPTAVTGNANVMLYLPTSKLRDNADYHAYGFNGKNYYYMAAITDIAATTGFLTDGPALSPLEAEYIDGKMDDGFPFTGLVRAQSALNAIDIAAAPAGGVCVSNGAGNPYNLVVDFRHDIACRLRIRMNF